MLSIYYICMSVLTVEVLKEIIKNLPNEYSIEYENEVT